MSRLEIELVGRARETVDRLRRVAERRLASSPPGVCPIDVARDFLTLCQSQSCGKCAPCRIGLAQLERLLGEVLDGEADASVLDLIQNTAQTIADTADCVIGIEAAQTILLGLKGFRDDYESRVANGRWQKAAEAAVPCVSQCPAHVDVPGYLALVREGRCADAVRLIRKDNPFPSACAYVCEHPCETRCRRGMVDAPLNIRAMKKFAVDNSKDVPQPVCAEKTGKKIAVVGGGPSGLTAAYFLALMGHSVVVFEKRKSLGGMLRYGIPNYRLPRTLLDEEIQSILSLGVEAKTGVDIGVDVKFEELRQEFDAFYFAIGAHTDKKLQIDGETSEGVVSAVQMLREVGDGKIPDFKGKRVVVVGGGNVAMDCVRTSVRCGAASVVCAYRRRKEDMTALPEEIEGAIAEGAEVRELVAPVRVEANEKGVAIALWVQPQIAGAIDSAGRPQPERADSPEIRIPADVVVVAIGQKIESYAAKDAGVGTENWGAMVADLTTAVPGLNGVFAGGDCVTDPAAAIEAIAAGKTAAANIDEYLGFEHKISVDVEIPTARFSDLKPCGRVITTLRDAAERKNDFETIEIGATCQEAKQESSRCLRCDYFGYGVLRGGRQDRW